MTIKQQGGIFGRNPTFNDVTVEGTLTSSGTTSYTSLDVNTISMVSNNPLIYLDDTDVADNNTRLRNQSGIFRIQDVADDGSTTTQVQLAHSTGDLTVSTGNLVIGTSGKGIDFSATSGTGTSELFDDYEEGSWTPTPTQSAFVNPTGSYVKIGKTVFASFELTGFTTTLGNFFEIRGLPYAAANDGQNVGSLGFIDNGVTDYIFRVLSGTPRIAVYNSSGTIYRYNTISDDKIAGAVVYETT